MFHVKHFLPESPLFSKIYGLDLARPEAACYNDIYVRPRTGSGGETRPRGVSPVRPEIR